jgi:hypothetical protein
MTNAKNMKASQLSVARYVPDSPYFHPSAPTLASSLAAFSEGPAFKAALSRFGREASCLVIGYSAPSNTQALRQVLRENSIMDPSILVVDRLPIPRIYAEMGIEMPDMDFLQLDACTAGDTLGGRRFDLIVQDFVLNCMPPAHAPAMLRSTRALLEPKGLALISLSTDAQPTGSPAQPIAQTLSHWADRWTNSVWSISDMAHSEEEYSQMTAQLAGRTMVDEATGHLVQVTSPACQFEFFAPGKEMDHLFEQSGLAITRAHVSQAVDYSGLMCTRHRLIATPA